MSLVKEAGKMVSSAVVQMIFDNTQFDKKIQQSIESLNNLNKSLKLEDSVKSANKSLASINTVDLSVISSGIASLEKRFSTFGIVGMEVIQRITNSVLNMGAQLKSITFGKIFQGGKNRAMNIEQARFMLKGMIDDQTEIKKIEDDAMDSVDGTAYTFDAAAKAAAQFAATGMRGGEQMQHALAGITGAAAMTNSEYEDMSRIFTTVSGNGKLMGDQLMQFSSRGMNVAANMKDYFNDVNSGAKEASESVKEAIQTLTKGKEITEGDFREMVSKGDVSFEIFAESMYQLYGEHAKKANETLTGVIANTGSALSKMGEKFYSPLVKQNGPLVKFFQTVRLNILELRKFLDPIMIGLSNNLVVTINRITEVLKKMKFPEAKDSYVIIRNLTRAFESLKYVASGVGSIFKSFRKSFDEFGFIDFFPDESAIDAIFSRIKEGAKAFSEFTKSAKGVQYFKDVFTGVLSVASSLIHIFSAIKIAIQPIIDLFKELFSEIFWSLDDAGTGLEKFNKWLIAIDGFNIYGKAKAIAAVIADAISYMKKFASSAAEVGKSIKEWFETKTDIKNFFKNMKDGIEEVDHKLSPLKQVVDFVKKALMGLWQSIKVTIGPLLEGVGGSLKGALTVLMDAIRDIFSGKGFESVLALVNSSIFTAAYAKLFKLFDLFVKSMKGDTAQKSWADRMGFSKPLNALTATLKQMQSDLKAGVLQKIAVAIGVIAGSLILLSQIETAKLRMAVVTISMLVVVLVAALKVLEGGAFDGIKDSIAGLAKGLSTKMIGDAAMKFAIAIGILAVAVKLLSTMEWEDIAKGLAVVTALVIEVVAAMKLIPNDFGFKGISLIGFGISMLMLAGVLKILATMSWKDIGQSLAALGGALFEILVVLMTLGEAEGSVLKGSAAMLLIMPTIVALAGVLKILGTMDFEHISVALVGLGSSLWGIAYIMSLTGETAGNVAKGAAVMLLIIPTITALSLCLRLLGTMSIDEAFTAIVALGGSIEIISLMLMAIGKNSEGMLKGAAATMLMIPIMITMTTLIKDLGKLDIASVGTALAGLVGVMLAFGYFVESMRGIKLEQMGAMATMAGVISSISNSLVKLGGMNLEQVCVALLTLAGAMLEFWVLAKVMAKLAMPAMEGSAAMFVMAAAMLVMSSALKSLSGINLIAIGAGLLSLFVAIGALAGAAAIVSKLPGLTTAMFKLGLSLMSLAAAMALFGIGMLAFTTSMAILVTTGTAGAVAFVGVIAVIADGIVKIAPKIREALVALIAETCIAISEAAPKIAKAALDVVVSILGEIASHIDEIVYELGMIILGIIDGLAEFIGEHSDELEAAIGNLIVNLLYFAAQALIDLWDWFWGMIAGFFQDIIDAILEFFGIHSPSTVFADIGRNLMQGLLDGITSFFDLIGGAIESLCTLIIEKLNPLYDISSSVGESIYDALHPDEAGKDIDTARNAVLQKAFNQHNAGVKSSEVSGQEALFLRQIEDAEAAAKSGAEYDTAGMDSEIAKYYNQCKKEASGFYDSTTKAAAEAGKESGAQYSASHYAEIEKSKNQNAQQAEQYYEPNKAAAKEAGTVSGNNYDANHYAAIEQAKGKNTSRAESYYSPYTDIAKEYGLDSGMFYDTNTASGMDKYSNIVESSGEKVGSAGADGAKSQKKEFRNTGAQYDLGLAQGISDPGAQGAVVKSVHNLGNRMVNELRRTLDEHSPSRVAEDIGEFFVLGLKDGITDTENVATKAVANLGDNIITKMSDSLSSTDVEEKFSNIQDVMYKVAAFRDTDLNVHPTITPVLSLDNVNSGLAAIDQMFSTERSLQLSANAYSQFDDTNNINSMLESMNSNNTKVVQAISDIRGDITKLETSMARMRIFLDSGALVGGIVTDVDNALGNIAFLKKRTGGM